MLCKAYLAACAYFCLWTMSVAVQPQAQVPLSAEGQDRAKILNDIQAKHSLAHTLGRQGEAAEAESLLRAILDLQQNTLGLPDDDDDVLTTKNNLAAQLHHQLKYDEAEALHRAVLEANVQARGPDNQHNIPYLGNLASLLADTDREAEAFARLEEAVDLAHRIWGPSDPHEEGLMVTEHLANRFAHKGDLVQAEVLWTRVLQGYKKLQDDGVRSKEEGGFVAHRLRVKCKLASAWGKTGRSEEAVGLFEEVIKEAEDPWDKGCALVDFGTHFERLGKLNEAEQVMREGLTLVMSSRRHDDGWIRHSEDRFKDILRKQGKTKEAEDFHVESLVAE